MKWLLWIVVFLGTAYITVGMALYLLQGYLIFPRTVNEVPTPDYGNPPGVDYLSITTPDGAVLNGIGFNTDPALSPSATTLVIAFGGNNHDATGMARFLHDKVFPEDTFAVAGLSYRGYPNALGRPSTGTPTQNNLEADALLIYDTLAARKQWENVYVIGYSMGAAVATHVALNREVGRLTLVAPFASITDIAQRRYVIYPARHLVNHPFNVAAVIGKVEVPTTVIYSPVDGLIPADHIATLQQALPAATFIGLNPPVGHGEVLNHSTMPYLLRQASGLR